MGQPHPLNHIGMSFYHIKLNRPHHTFLDQGFNPHPNVDNIERTSNFETAPLVQLVKYYYTMAYIVTSQLIDSQCAEITFFNNSPVASGANMSINGLIFPPQQGISFTDNDMEFDTTKYQLIFQPTGVFTTQNCLVIRKMYVNL